MVGNFNVFQVIKSERWGKVLTPYSSAVTTLNTIPGTVLYNEGTIIFKISVTYTIT